MAEYKGIKGFKTQSYATDPVATGVAGATWTTSNDMLQGRYGAGGCGTQTAGFICNGVGGGPGGDIGVITNCETYDGTCWSEGNNMLVGRGSAAMAGTTTAAVYAGGFPGSFATSETWDGTSWTETNNITTGRGDFGVCGTQTAMLVWGGWTGSVQDLCEEYDGTCWSESGDLGTGRYFAQGFGIQTLALAGEGGPAPAGRVCEEYDGATWSSGTAFNTNRMYGAAAGTFTAGLVIAGQSPGTIANTESWNGSAWTERADVNTGRTALNPQNIGTQVAALIGSGAVPPTTNVTEEFNEPGADSTLLNEGQIWYNTTGGALKYTAIAAGTWASGGTLPANYFSMGASGTLAAGLAYGGQGGNTGTYTYSSSTWSTSPATLNNGRHNIVSSGIGTSTAAQCMGGEIPAPPNYGVFTEQFNGSAWTEVAAPGGSLNTGRYGSAGGGTQTAAILSMGTTGSGTDATETWNGSSWTTGTAAPQAKWYVAGGGPQSDFITAGGTNSAPTSVATSDYWNGTSWTEVADLNTNRILAGRAAGAGTSAIIFGGETPPAKANTEKWDGTSWTEVADLSTPASAKAGSGTASLAFGVGNASPNNGATEEWDETVLTVKTVTVS